MLLGHTCVCAVEIEPYCRQVLLQRQRDGILPRFPIWDDIRTFDGKPWRGLVDVVAGGFPCQGISAAGKGEGLNDPRSGLWFEMRRVVCEVAPSIVFVENSPMLTSRGLGTVLGDLAALGYDAKWGVLGAVDAGAPHERERLWVVADADKGRSKRTCSASERKPIRHDPTRSENAKWWLSESSVDRVADGVADRVDRISAIGNGQVPRVVRLAWETLSAEFVKP